MGVDVISCLQSENLAVAAAFLAARGADFVVVGGCALRSHGFDHVPADLDVVPEPSLNNLRTLFDAIAALGTVGPTRVPTDHALTTHDIVTRTTPIGSIDVMLVTGRNEYRSLQPAATSVVVKGRAVRVAALDEVLRLRARFGKPSVRV